MFSLCQEFLGKIIQIVGPYWLLVYLPHWSFTFLQYSIHTSFRAFIYMFVLQLPCDHNLTPWNQIPSLALANLCPSDLVSEVANGTEFWVYWTLFLEALAVLLQWCMCNYVRWIVSFGRILPCGWPRYKPPRKGCPFPILPVLNTYTLFYLTLHVSELSAELGHQYKVCLLPHRSMLISSHCRTLQLSKQARLLTRRDCRFFNLRRGFE